MAFKNGTPFPSPYPATCQYFIITHHIQFFLEPLEIELEFYRLKHPLQSTEQRQFHYQISLFPWQRQENAPFKDNKI